MSAAETPEVVWEDLFRALRFAEKAFERWHERGFLRRDQAKSLAEFYAQYREQLTRSREAGLVPPSQTGLPPDGGPAPETKAAQAFRYWTFVGHEIRKQEKACRLALSQANACLADVREHCAALRRRLDEEALPEVLPVVEWVSAEVPQPLPRTRRPLLEILLDLRNIQRLLALGAVLLVLGLVLFLIAAGLFDNPVVVAILMGAGTLALLGTGWYVLGATPYQLAGKALTLLACLVMPLNLWFYHAQGLHPLTLYEHLWVAALVSCALYAASARVVRDAVFVYVLNVGVALTSLLLLANVVGPVAFWQITHPAVLLTVLGLVTLHIERAFPDSSDGPFTRRQFGLAFFRSGHALLAIGLLLVLGAQLYGYTYRLFPAEFQAWELYGPAPLTSDPSLKLLALVLVLASTYAYFYSDLVVRRLGLFVYPAVFTLLWAEVLVLDLLPLRWTHELAIVVLALTALVVNLILGRTDQPGTASRSLARGRFPVGLLLATLPVLLGVGLHARWLLFRSTTDSRELGWTYVAAMLVTAASCRVGAHLYRRTQPTLATVYFFGTAVATLVGSAGLLAVLGLKTWAAQAPLLMLLPLAYLVAARLYAGRAPERPVLFVAHACMAIMLLSSLVAAVHGFPVVPGRVAAPAPAVDPLTDALSAAFQGFVLTRGEVLNLLLAAFFAEAAVFYGLAAIFRRQVFSIYLATALACAALWQLLNFSQTPGVYYTVAYALTGLVLLVVCRFAGLERLPVVGLPGTAFRCANALLSVGLVAGALLTLGHLADNQTTLELPQLGMVIGLLVINLLALGLVGHAAWRRWYVVTAVAEAVLALLVLAVSLPALQQLEIVSILLGLALLIVAHVGWYQEQERQSDQVGLGLLLGSLLVAVPLTLGMLSYRCLGEFHWPDELGMLAAGIVLFATGSMFRLRSTTLTGAAQLLVYVVTLLVYLPWSHWLANRAAVLLMGGGGTVFAVGLLLSIYRDSLLALPERIKRRQGVFRVLSWR
jgi:hypothetical protein